MEKTMLQAVLLNPFRSQKPAGFYSKLKGHTGEDRKFTIGDTILSPVTGTVMKTAVQTEMGKVLYLRHDATGDIHVFAHNSSFLVKPGDKVKRLQPIVLTGNTGTKTTAPHSHWEIIILKLADGTMPADVIDPAKGGAPINKVMTRSLNGFVGWNICPSERLKAVYKPFGIDPVSGKGP